VARCMIKAGSVIRDKDTDIVYVVKHDTHIEAPRLPVTAFEFIGRCDEKDIPTKYIEMKHSWTTNAVNVDLSKAKLEEY